MKGFVIKKTVSLLLALLTLACTPLLFASCGPNQKSATIPVDYLVTYEFVNGYGEEMTITIGENQRDYEDDYYYYSDGTVEIIEKRPHGNGISSYWEKDLTAGGSAQFAPIEDVASWNKPALFGIKLINFGTYRGGDDIGSFGTGGADWRSAGELEEITFDQELDSLEGSTLAGRNVTFYSFTSAYDYGEYGPAKIALDNKYAFVMYFCFDSAPELKDKNAALEKDRYKAYQGPFSRMLCTSCKLDDEAPIIQDMLP